MNKIRNQQNTLNTGGGLLLKHIINNFVCHEESPQVNKLRGCGQTILQGTLLPEQKLCCVFVVKYFIHYEKD